MMQLPKYMVGIAYNIKTFNKHVQELQMELTKYNEHGDDLLTTSLLVAYEHVPDAEFQHVLHRKRDQHDTNTAMPSYCPEQEPSASTTRSPEGIQFVGWSRRRRNNPMCPKLWLSDSKPYFWCKYHGHWSLNEGHSFGFMYRPWFPVSQENTIGRRPSRKGNSGHPFGFGLPPHEDQEEDNEG